MVIVIFIFIIRLILHTSQEKFNTFEGIKSHLSLTKGYKQAIHSKIKKKSFYGLEKPKSYGISNYTITNIKSKYLGHDIVYKVPIGLT